MRFFIENILFIAYLPLFVAVTIILSMIFKCQFSKKTELIATLSSTFIGFIFSLFAIICCIKNPDKSFDYDFVWINLNNIQLHLGAFLDNLACSMLLLVTFISFVVQLFSYQFMREDDNYSKYFAYLNIFHFSMIGLILSPNLFQLYIFWEMVGVMSYLLIGFWFKKPSAEKAAKKAFIINRIGDVCFLVGILALFLYGFQINEVFSTDMIAFAGWENFVNILKGLTSNITFNVICILLLMGAIAKSAQFPLHVWLPDAMEAPTPVSALIHASTMVAAGVFLVGRLYPLFVMSDFVMTTVMIVGLITAILASVIACFQNDIKRVLAYSTSAQLGLMFVALGAKAYSSGFFHLFTHAFTKASLFLIAGVIIYALKHSTQNIQNMGELKKQLPVCSWLYLLSCISLSGLFFGGFSSKESILYALSNNVYLVLALFVSFLTAFYMFKTYFMIFEGSQRCEMEICDEKTMKPMIVSVFILIVPMCLLMFCGGYFYKIIIYSHVIQLHKINIIVLLSSILVSGLGAYIAYIFYKNGLFLSEKYNRCNKFMSSFIDDVYGVCIVRPFKVISELLSAFDKHILCGIVNLTAFFTRVKSYVISKLQTGNVQSYIAYAILFTGIISAFVVIVYYWSLRG